MHTNDVGDQIGCPICGHDVRRYEDESGTIVYCNWCGTVAAFTLAESLVGDSSATALLEGAKHSLLARALLFHAQELRRNSARLLVALQSFRTAKSSRK
jgi:hypothetical protein